MEKLIKELTESWQIESTKQTPAIHFDGDNQLIVFKGEMYPENITEFSEPIFSWLEKYLEQPTNLTLTVNIELNYFNSSSSKLLLDLFDKLEEAVINGNRNIMVNWIYDSDNEYAQEYGEEFQEDLEYLPFHLVSKNI